jgi:DNA adenine methylase
MQTTVAQEARRVLEQANVTSRKSPLRYPGGKSKARAQILELIPPGTEELASPFLGGGSVEIAAANLRGIRVHAYDIFEPLIDFWTELLENPERLADEIRQHYPLTREEFYALKAETPTTRLERAAHFYVINRCSFSGSTFSGGMSPDHPRFTLGLIDKLRHFRCPNISVACQDFRETLTQHAETLCYLDPPYRIPINLYGRNGDAHRDFDHEGLSQLLGQRGRWILSYNDCDEVRDMYPGYRTVTPQWKYGMSNDKNSREIIIVSHDIPL